MEESHFLENTWNELNNAITIKDHPFRFCTLATRVDKNELKQRILVLRAITDENTLIFYTDFRSNKVSQILQNSTGSILFYNPEKSLQLSLKGKLSINTKGSLWEAHVKKIENKAKDDYNTVQPPGSILENSTDLERYSRLNFCVLEFKIKTIDYLAIK